jgi:adenine-specific DNA-methyltransferase
LYAFGHGDSDEGMPVARIHDLIKQLRISNPELASEISREFDLLSQRRAFGLNFERHTPETVELPGRRVRVGDKVRNLPPRGRTRAFEYEHERLWRVLSIKGPRDTRSAELEALVSRDGVEQTTALVADLTVVAEFRDPIYPGLVSNGKVERGGDKPFHTVINAENYHALQALLFTHRGAVDVIYIDPPYNTGARDWKYNDHYVESDDQYRHSIWRAMIERRLLLAKELLSITGLIFVSIDDREQASLRLLLDRIFAAENFVATFIWRTDGNLDNQATIKTNHEYVIAYARSTQDAFISGIKDLNLDEDSKLFNKEIRNSVIKNGPKNPISSITLEPGFPATMADAVIPARKDRWPHFDEDIVVHNGLLQNRVSVTSGWASANLLRAFIRNGYAPVVDTKGQETVFQITHTGAIEGVKVRRSNQHHILTVLMNMGTVETAGNYLQSLGITFPYPKPLPLIEYILSMGPRDGIFVDFFAGSGTTAHATMLLNKLDGGRRRSISVTNNDVSSSMREALLAKGARSIDPEWSQCGTFEAVTAARIRGALNSNQLDENVEFFTLTYESAMRVQANREFSRIAPLLWLRAGSEGRRIESLPDGWDVADTYGVIEDMDKTESFIEAMAANQRAKLAFVVTDEDRFFEAIDRAVLEGVETVRLYDSYLRNFEIDAMRGER